VTTIDPDGETRSYSISGTDADKFTIDAATGQIKVGANPDLDYEDDAKNSFAVTVTATDPKGMTTAIDVAIIVTGVNEAPYSEQKTVTLTTPENQPIGTVIPGFPLAKDPEDDVLDYYVHGQTDNDDFSNFEIDVSNGQPRLKIKKRLDYKNSGPDLAYNFEVRVQDPEPLMTSIMVTVKVTDVNEPLYPFRPSMATRTVPENSPAGTNVGQPVTTRR
jgi:hypothetical protein